MSQKVSQTPITTATSYDTSIFLDLKEKYEPYICFKCKKISKNMLQVHKKKYIKTSKKNGTSL